MVGSIMFTVIFLIVVVLFLCASIYIVPQQNVYIIERFGKFHRLSNPGIHLRIPVVDVIASRVSMRIHQITQQITTKTEDNVFVQLSVSVQYRVDSQNIAASFYELSNPEMQIRSYVEDNIRNAVPAITLDDAFSQKDQIANDVQETLRSSMAQFGYVIIQTLITDIEPDAAVKDAMNSINEAQRRKVAAKELAEADKITVVVKAEAEAEEARLHGKGIADQRKEIVNGLDESFNQLKKDGMSEIEIMSIILTEQYLDVLNSLSNSDNTKVLMMPSGANSVSNIQQSIIAGIEASKNGLIDGEDPGLLNYINV